MSDLDLAALVSRAANGDAPARRRLAARLAENPLQQALFGAAPELLADHLLGYAALTPVCRAGLSQCGIGRPGDAYLFDMLLPLLRFFHPRVMAAQRPYLIGLAGGPGAGKTTLSRLLARCLGAMIAPEPVCLSLSLDDFYRPKEERLRRGFKWRTPPGTHDTERLADFIAELDRPGPAALAVPRYDLGRDAPMADETLTVRPDICIFDGAMVGSRLPGYDVLAQRLDFMIFLDLPLPLLKHWRFERERRLREASGGRIGFSEPDMHAFWDEALGPCFEAWVLPNTKMADLVLGIDGTRQITAARRPLACVTEGGR